MFLLKISAGTISKNSKKQTITNDMATAVKNAVAMATKRGTGSRHATSLIVCNPMSSNRSFALAKCDRLLPA